MPWVYLSPFLSALMMNLSGRNCAYVRLFYNNLLRLPQVTVCLRNIFSLRLLTHALGSHGQFCLIPHIRQNRKALLAELLTGLFFPPG